MLKSAIKKLLRSMDISVIVLQHSKNEVIASWDKSDSPVDLMRGSVRAFLFNGELIRFFVENEADHIQRQQLGGAFYEEEELALIGKYFRGGHFVDVGANVGNHIVYACTQLNATKVTGFEPNQAALRVLEINLLLNALSGSVSVRPVALSNAVGRGSSAAPSNNLGGARVLMDPHNGRFSVATGDEELINETSVDFVKIDTEGLELEVLEGLLTTVEKHNPFIFVEVAESNRAGFEAILGKMRYRVMEEFKRYEANTNFIVGPADGS